MVLDRELLLVDRVERRLRKEVARLEGVPGAKLAQESVLASRYKVSRQTLRQALERLKEEKLVRSARGSGTFIVPRLAARTEAYFFTVETPHPYGHMVSNVLSRELKKSGYTFHPVISSNPAGEVERISRRPEALGIFIVGGFFPRPQVEEIVKHSAIPVVQIGFLAEPMLTAPVCDTVVPEIMAMVGKAVEYLVAQGHRRIALLHWSHDLVWNRELLRCYREALEVHGIIPDTDWVVQLPSDAVEDIDQGWLDKAGKHVAGWHEKGEAPTAMLHTSTSEARVHDLLQMVFRGHFKNENVVPITSWEILQVMYTGIRGATAAAIKFEELVAKAIELMVRRKDQKLKLPPVRETYGRVYLCHRTMGRWTQGEE